MSSPKPPAKSTTRQSPKPSPDRRARPGSSGPQPTTPLEIVDPIWLAKALALSIIAALLCAWLTACLLFYQGEWQLILHPSHTVDRTPASANLAFDEIHFDAAATGQPRLTAWWIPATPGSKYEPFTILYLHDGTGSLSTTLPELARLHQTGINIFAIDYRGFGQSDASEHPTQATMAQDTAAALDYLISTRHIPTANIVPYGVGLGASLAVSLALAHPQLPAVILDNPDPDPTATAVASHPSRVVPVRLLFREHFDIAAPLATLTTPKLLIAGGPNSATSATRLPALQTLFRRAASPSLTVTLPTGPKASAETYQTTLNRFLDQYLPSTPQPPAPAR